MSDVAELLATELRKTLKQVSVERWFPLKRRGSEEQLVEITSVVRWSRHWLRVTLSDGRSLVVAPDHRVFVTRCKKSPRGRKFAS